MDDYDAFIDTLDAMLVNNPKSKSERMLETLNTIVSLMNESGSGRFDGARYERIFEHPRLKITVQFKGNRS
jgi:hypothetical protein